MTATEYGLIAICGMFFGMLLLLLAGRRLGVRRLARDPDAVKVGSPAIEGAVFGLMGLLIAFTFSGAAARFDARRRAQALMRPTQSAPPGCGLICSR